MLRQIRNTMAGTWSLGARGFAVWRKNGTRILAQKAVWKVGQTLFASPRHTCNGFSSFLQRRLRIIVLSLWKSKESIPVAWLVPDEERHRQDVELANNGIAPIAVSSAPLTPNVGSAFKRRVLHHMGITDESAVDSRGRMYVDFALSANARGQTIANLLAGYTPLAGKRYLDIGCAYGGFLVSFAKRGCRPIVGIDIDESLLELGRINCLEQNVDAMISRRDVLAPSILDLGQFDLITCNDVMEHVPLADRAIEHIAGLTAPGGLVFFQIPNRFYLDFIREDGHYKLPGITLLAYPDAESYFHLNCAQAHYDVYYHSLEYYRQSLLRHGFIVHMINDLGMPLSSLRPMLVDAMAELDRLENRVVITSALAQKIRCRARVIQEDLLSKLDQFSHTANARLAYPLAQKILFRYGVSFWWIIAVQPKRKSDAVATNDEYR